MKKFKILFSIIYLKIFEIGKKIAFLQFHFWFYKINKSITNSNLDKVLNNLDKVLNKI